MNTNRQAGGLLEDRSGSADAALRFLRVGREEAPTCLLTATCFAGALLPSALRLSRSEVLLPVCPPGETPSCSLPSCPRFLALLWVYLQQPSLSEAAGAAQIGWAPALPAPPTSAPADFGGQGGRRSAPPSSPRGTERSAGRSPRAQGLL